MTGEVSHGSIGILLAIQQDTCIVDRCLVELRQSGIYLHHPHDERTEQIITNRQVD